MEKVTKKLTPYAYKKSLHLRTILGRIESVFLFDSHNNFG